MHRSSGPTGTTDCDQENRLKPAFKYKQKRSWTPSFGIEGSPWGKAEGECSPKLCKSSSINKNKIRDYHRIKYFFHLYKCVLPSRSCYILFTGPLGLDLKYIPPTLTKIFNSRFCPSAIINPTRWDETLVTVSTVVETSRARDREHSFQTETEDTHPRPKTRFWDPHLEVPRLRPFQLSCMCSLFNIIGGALVFL